MKDKSIGGLYNRVSQKGVQYLAGFITPVGGTKFKIVAFPQQFKNSDRSPDYAIFVSELKRYNPAEAKQGFKKKSRKRARLAR